MDARGEQYVLLAKGARGRAIADCIRKATSDPGLFGFSELLAVPSVKEIQSGELAPHYNLLQLFAFGVWSDYKGSAAGLPPLTEQQATKLKQLTLVSLALKIKVLSYQLLQQQLDIPTVRELEDFIITECFYSHIISGKLDQKKGCLMVHNAIGRDVRPEQLPELEAGLQNWVQSAERVLGQIEARIQYAAAATEEHKKEREQVEKRAALVKSSLKDDVMSREDLMMDDGGGAGGHDFMDEDRLDRLPGGPSLGMGMGMGAERSDRMGAGRPKRRLR